MMDEIEQRKQKAKDAGYTSPFCASCAHMSTPSSKECKKCIEAAPAFNAAIKQFLKGVKH